ncbi:hypothetical protein [Hymenobacter amundsenii]|nr:hypothetical protein [Hymenobacter amundsenii]
MAQHLLFQDSTISIAYDYVQEWLFVNWLGEQDGDTVRAGAMKMLEFVRQQRCTKVLNSNQEVTSMWQDAAEWGGREWFPLMQEAGCHYFAWIYSPNLYSRLSTDLTLQHNVAGIIVCTFDDVETASAWLKLM